MILAKSYNDIPHCFFQNVILRHYLMICVTSFDDISGEAIFTKFSFSQVLHIYRSIDYFFPPAHSILSFFKNLSYMQYWFSFSGPEIWPHSFSVPICTQSYSAKDTLWYTSQIHFSILNLFTRVIYWSAANTWPNLLWE